MLCLWKCITIYLFFSINLVRLQCFTNLTWSEYKTLHNKSFSILLEAKRRLFWQQNMKKDVQFCIVGSNLCMQQCDENQDKALVRIIEHNEQAARGEHSYRLAPNHLADLHVRHYHRKLMVLRPSKRHFQDTLLELLEHELESLPLTFDWRDHGLLTQPLDQQDCGSCYAFSVAAAVQAQLFKKNGTLEYLSPQQLVDCSVLTGNYGCNGGSLRSTARYVQSSGLMLETDYPYRARQSACKINLLKQRVHINSWQILPARDEFALQAAVVTKGPVVVALNASPQTFQLYHSGVYDDPNCPDDHLNHAMLLIGYTKDAWILKNWWTNRWGHDGYMYLRRDVNRCGVADYAMIVQI